MRKPSGLRVFCSVSVACVLSAISLPAQTLSTLASFDGTDGKFPENALVQGTDGNLYGTVPYGGLSGGNCLADGCGTVVRITPDGALTTIYKFCAQPNCLDGSYPIGGLLLASDGNFYGTTYSGGSGSGTVFRLVAGGTLTTLHSFSGPREGGLPAGALIEAGDGNFYGTTSEGGDSDFCLGGCGTIFKITAAGTLTTLHNFCAKDRDPVCANGATPMGGLTEATDGNFYGTTYGGGGSGTVFKLTSDGVFTTLHRFVSAPTGAGPSGTLVQGSDGRLYGTTSGGGQGSGTVFSISTEGAFSTLYVFRGTDGQDPLSSLIQASDGSFYGTTYYGGTNKAGTVYKIDSTGDLTTLYNFGSQSGANPAGLLTQGTNGTFYGTTHFGGEYQDGTIFSLSVGLGPFVITLPTAGKAGSTVRILGNNLMGATSVNFNGTPAAFTVESNSFIRITVPAGALTGPVQVITPSGTLTSIVNFQVLP